MKKFLAIAIILLSSIQTFAQTHYSSNVAIGGKAGIDISRIFFNPSVKQGWPVNPTMGFMFRYIEENHFGLIAEFNWVRRGWADNFEGLPFRYRKNLDYLEIPVLAHIYFGGQTRFFFNSGPQIGFRIAESTSSNFNPADIASIPDFPNQNRRNDQFFEKVSQKVDFGISAGLGCEYNINPQNAVNFEARYYFGLGNIFPAGRQDTFRASNSMYIALTFGYWYRIK